MTLQEAENVTEHTQPNASVHISEISFNDGTTLKLNQESIVVFTGTNNCGKSQILKDIMLKLTTNTKTQAKVVRNIKIEHIGTLKEDFFANLQRYDTDKYSIDFGFGGYLKTREEISQIWLKGQSMGSLYRQAFKILDTEKRLITSKSKQASSADLHGEILPSLSNNVKAEEKISKYFKKAFNKSIALHKDFKGLSLHVGEFSSRESMTLAQEDEYYRDVASKPLLDIQGDGMRSFATILLEIFTTNHSAMLIDEPEAFLHPPQAKIAGSMMSKNDHFKGQLFISTHSEDFIQGLLGGNSDNVIVVKINREGDVSKIHPLNSNDLKEIWRTPILRYSNVFKGLFHDKVVICEGDRDCLFYQAVIDSMCEQGDKIPPSILYTHCGGKDKVKDVAKILTTLKIPTTAILDFDILVNKSKLKSLIEALGGDFEPFKDSTKKIYNWVNAKNQEKGSGDWFKDGLKEHGKEIFNGEAADAFREMDSLCKSIGLYIVPVGELECFHKCSKEKQDWVYYMLENFNLATSDELQAARDFVKPIFLNNEA